MSNDPEKNDEPGVIKQDYPGHPKGTTGELEGRRPYSAPMILSAEFLEATAVTCDGSAGGFGKTITSPPFCTTLGS